MRHVRARENENGANVVIYGAKCWYGGANVGP